MNWLTIVIPTYNRAEVLRKALDGYKSQSASEAIAELIVVDDGSTDHTKRQLRIQPELHIPDAPHLAAEQGASGREKCRDTGGAFGANAFF